MLEVIGNRLFTTRFISKQRVDKRMIPSNTMTIAACHRCVRRPYLYRSFRHQYQEFKGHVTLTEFNGSTDNAWRLYPEQSYL